MLSASHCGNAVADQPQGGASRGLLENCHVERWASTEIEVLRKKRLRVACVKLTNPIMHIMFIGLRIQILCVTILDLSRAELSAARTLCTNDLLTSRLVFQIPQVDCFPKLQTGGMACRALSSDVAILPICCEQGDLSQRRFAEHARASADLTWQHLFPRPSATELRAVHRFKVT